MIRAILCLRRKEGLSLLEFRRVLEARAGGVLARYCEAAGATDFQLREVFQVAENERFRSIWGGTTPYDAVVEIFWPNGQACREGTRRAAVELAQRQPELAALLDSSATTLTYVQD